MKKYNVQDIRGGEVLAKPLMTSSYRVILSENAVLRKEYIERLKELGFQEIYIKEENADRRDAQEIRYVRQDVETSFRKKVKAILESHVDLDNDDLRELNQVAEDIIYSILEEEDVIESVIAIKERSADIYEHAVNCCVLAVILSARMKLDHDTIHSIGVGCLLHDIGLRYITQDFQDVKIEKMPEEWQIEYKKHPVYGYCKLKDQGWLSQLSKDIILYHHECEDGSGYSFHRKKMPQEIAIVNVCDSFDELISGIGCRRMRVYKAVEYLKCFQNIKFNDKIVNEFLGIIAVYTTGSKVRMINGEEAVVIRQNRDFPDRPVVRITRNKRGEYLSNGKEIDLLKERTNFITNVLN